MTQPATAELVLVALCTLLAADSTDLARGKPTFPSLLGIQGARDHLSQLKKLALQSLAGFGAEADPLRAIADYVVARTH